MTRVSRKEAKERTRRRLLEAVLDLVRNEGLSGLTTGRVAEAAGIAQSSFYVHFNGMEEALEALAHDVGEEVRATLREGRQAINISPDENREAALRGAYRATLAALLRIPAFAEILVAQRRDRTTPLGDCLRSIVDQARDELAADLVTMGYGNTSEAKLSVYTELISGMTMAAVEGIVDGRLNDQDACIDCLVRTTIALVAPE